MPDETERAWSIRPYSRGDETAVGTLYERVFARPFNEALWKWQFEGAVANMGYIYFAEHGGRLIGQYATIPVRMLIRGVETLASLSLDTMTHPDFRKQGIFVTLAREVYGQTRSIGVRLVYGFPNGNSLHGFVADLDFIVLENIVAMTRPLSIERVVREKTNVPLLAKLLGVPLQGAFNALCSRQPKDASVLIEPAPRFPEAVTVLFNDLAPKFENLVIRDYRYLSWRYDRNPRHRYDIFLGYRGDKLAGYCVSGATVRRGVRIGLIVDIFADPADRALGSALVSAAVETMERKGMHCASCLLSSRSPFRAVLRGLGFVFPARRFPFIVRINADASSEALTRDAVWHVTFGDGDFV